mmetsp:Transcript_9883/g.26047  ORF Transcript_9883/g.26047 Transcript_9883/m.26047 type:complete len:405 (-) Transcript_9883:203-1417(-)
MAGTAAVAASDHFGNFSTAVALTIGVVSAVLFILRSRGWLVQLSTCTYIASLVVTQLLMKRLTSAPLEYRFPATVTALHFFSVWGTCVVYWAAQRDLTKCKASSIGSTRRYVATILPIACSLPLSVVFNNQAMLYVGASVNAVIGTLTPVTTALLQQLLGRTFSKLSWGGIALACIGALVITFGETRSMFGDVTQHAEMYGVILSFVAVMCRSLKAVLQDKLLKPHEYEAVAEQPLAALHVWVVQAPLCAFVATCQALMSESVSEAWHELGFTSGAIIVCTCLSATTLNLLGMVAIKDLGASSMAIIGKLNVVIVVALSVALLGEHVPGLVFLGTGVTLLGVATFEYGNRIQSTTHLLASKQQFVPVATSATTIGFASIGTGGAENDMDTGIRGAVKLHSSRMV